MPDELPTRSERLRFWLIALLVALAALAFALFAEPGALPPEATPPAL